MPPFRLKATFFWSWPQTGPRATDRQDPDHEKRHDGFFHQDLLAARIPGPAGPSPSITRFVGRIVKGLPLSRDRQAFSSPRDPRRGRGRED
ncbi:MAG: hypothetical protein M0C28_05425 [Candidatus Moduliflexus flocculans]|nr:hypothetical protein [Candidatus Moduliflexus flocculans]